MGVRFQRANREPGAYLPPSRPFAAPTASLSSREGCGCCFAGGEFIWNFICLFLIHLHSSRFHRRRLSDFCISNQNGSAQEVDGTRSRPQLPDLTPRISTCIMPANALWFRSVAARAASSKPQETQITLRGKKEKEMVGGSIIHICRVGAAALLLVFFPPVHASSRPFIKLVVMSSALCCQPDK